MISDASRLGEVEADVELGVESESVFDIEASVESENDSDGTSSSVDTFTDSVFSVNCGVFNEAVSC